VQSFRPSGDGAALKLFEQTNIKLFHGWLCDPDSTEYAAIKDTQDYDSSIDLVVEADSLTKGQVVQGWESDPAAAPMSPVTLTDEQREKVENGAYFQTIGTAS
jgi:ubiquitin carboxyl-terminal hydrolase MINDY-1/2